MITLTRSLALKFGTLCEGIPGVGTFPGVKQ